MSLIMMNEQIVSENNYNKDTDLLKCTKEELISRIKTLMAHNTQLKNIIAKKSPTTVACKKETKQFDFTKYNFQHIALKILYLGWDYKGYVVQEDTTDTIEHHLFDALIRTKLIKDRASSNYHRCGRTDKGVSSFGQVISIDLRSHLKDCDDNEVKEIDYCNILNKVLPSNIQCLAWSLVDENFSARFDCQSRTYRYYFPKGDLKIERIQEASQKLLGAHDFRNFCKMDVGNGVMEFTRRISEIKIQPLSNNCDEYSMFVIEIKAKAFLWHQIRCLMGILFLIGQEKEDPSIIDELLDIKKHPRKPQYSMASEIPLNLFFCEYENLNWNYDEDTLKKVIEKLNAIWMMSSVKGSMVKDMLMSIKNEYGLTNDSGCLSNILIQEIKSKTHIPLLKRQTCNSLEDKIEHFTKRKKI